MGKLATYRQKRNFSKTPEPQGGRASQTTKLLYGIQKHAARRLHYDLRLEYDGTMMSWAVPKGPSFDPAEKRLAVKVEDHPIEYTRFEGTIPSGEYGAGNVLVWDIGTWAPLGSVKAMLADGVLKFEIFGERLRGRWVLVRMHDDENNWLLIKEKDGTEKPGDKDKVVKQWTKSVLNSTLVQKLGDQSLRPQLATLAKEPPEGDDWIHEIKFDGYRILASLRSNTVTLTSRNGLDWTNRFKSIAASLGSVLHEGDKVDGEVVVIDDTGRSDFSALQSWLSDGEGPNPVYMVFDMVESDGHSLLERPLIERKGELLKRLGQPGRDRQIRYSEHVEGHGPDFFREACKSGLEGVVSKRKGSPYVQRRSAAWIKSKCSDQDDFVIGGMTQPQGSRTGFGALLLGKFDQNGKLKYVGKVGSGFKERTISDLYSRLVASKSQEPHFENPPKTPRVTWLNPQYYAVVKYSETTSQGILRHPVFLGLREDLDVNQTQSEAKSHPPLPIKLTHPDRIVFPDTGLTKLSLANYYLRVAPLMLRFIKGRPLSVLRCPEGTQDKCFVQKHLSVGMPKNLARDPGGDEEPYLCANTFRDVLQLVQYGVVEFHVWGSKFRDLEHPDNLVFDLDPADDVPWETVIEAAEVLAEYVRSIGLTPFAKTTGGKGIHIVVPVKTNKLSWDEVKSFTKQVAVNIESFVPGHFVTVMGKDKRKGRIFIDYLRNGRGATCVAPYSARARNGAPVAAPIDWQELKNLRSGHQFTVESVNDWLRASVWEDYQTSAKTLTRQIVRSVFEAGGSV